MVTFSPAATVVFSRVNVACCSDKACEPTRMKKKSAKKRMTPRFITCAFRFMVV
jgi:hypothetical protein